MNFRDQQQLHSFAERTRLNDLLTEASDPSVSAALGKISAGELLEDSDAPIIEGIVLQEARPVLVVKDGTFEVPHTSTWKLLASYKEKIDRAIRSVGRINVSNVPGLQFAGTGFIVGDGLVMTTRRVAGFFTTGVGQTGVAIRSECSPELDLRCEGGTDSLQASIVGVALIHPFLDLALLRVRLPPEQSPPLVLSPVSVEDLVGRIVVVIGHISYDPARDISVLADFFGGMMGYKHVSPGYIAGSGIMESYGQQMWALTHDCSSLAGSSGGPVIDLETGSVVGLHVAGTPFGPNFAIPISEIARDGRIIQQVHFDRHVQPSQIAWQDFWDRADPSETRSETREDTGLRLNRPLAAQTIRDGARSLIGSTFGTADKFSEFLSANGYGTIVSAVPRGSGTSDSEYLEALLTALERRDQLEDLVEAMPSATGTSALPTHEPTAGFEVVLGSEPEDRGSLPALRVGDEPGQPSAAIIPDGVLKDLLDSVRHSPVDEAATLQKLALGSQWWDWLVRPDGTFGTVTETFERLAHDSHPEARQALTWLVGKLLQTIKTAEPERLRSLARGDAYLTSLGEQARPERQPAWPTDEQMTDLTYLARGIEASRAVVLVELSQEARQEARFSGCTGWLLTPSLVVAPAHLLQDPNDQQNQTKAVGKAKACQVRFDYDKSDAEPKTMSVLGVELFDPKLDLAVLRLSGTISDRAPLRVNPDPPAMTSTFVTTVHHPRLGPKKLSIWGGRLLESDAHQVIYVIATTVGSAGAPVFDIEWRVVATHRAWQTYRPSADAVPIRAKCGTSTSALLKALREVGGTAGQLWREVVAAQPALKVVDPSLYVRLAELEEQNSRATVPMVIEVLGPSVSLGDIPGLTVSTTGDFVVTARGTRESVDTLAARPEVLSVRASPQAGAVECVHSIPHTGASRIHDTVNERGDAALIAVIDTGTDIFHQSLRDETGRTRIVAFWDQKDERSPASDNENQAAESMSAAGREMVEAFGLTYGALYVAEDLQRFIDGAPLPATFPEAVRMTHGTTVCSVAAGRRTGESEDHFPGGVAPAASLIVVRYDLQDASVGYSVGHIDALDFIDKLAARLNRPVVVNISNGMNAGAHDGTSPVEKACQRFTGDGQAPGRVIVKSAGNERGKGHHAMLKVAHRSVAELRWRSKASRPGAKAVRDIVELWFDKMNRYQFRVKPPMGGWSPVISPVPSQLRELSEYLDNGNHAHGVLRLSNPENGDGSLHLEIAPGQVSEVEGGDWALEISGLEVKNNLPIHAWVEDTLNRELYFLDYLQDECTITIPGTAEHVITVGAIEVSDFMRPYPQSSTGPGRNGREKPEVVAPGVGIRAAQVGSVDGVDSRASVKSGTSVAAPHVTGAIALALSARAKRAGQQQFNSNEIRTPLLTSLRHFSAIWNETTGHGELDAAEFFTRLMGD